MPIVILSAAAEDRVRETVRAHGLSGYLLKPLRVQAVLREIERFC